MSEQYLLVFKIFLSAWFFTNFDPITKAIYKLEDKLQSIPSWLLNGFYVLQCFKCLSFWSVLIITQDIWYALTASLIASVYDNNNK